MLKYNDLALILKPVLYIILKKIQLDTLFRYLHRQNVLILAYHGVTKKKYDIPAYSHVHVDIFERQLILLKKKYNVISLREALTAIAANESLPANPAVITFDDGYKNNFTIAFPILKKHGIPATIFVTSGYIGTKKILPLDEAYLTLVALKNSPPLSIPEFHPEPLFFNTAEDIWGNYLKLYNLFRKSDTYKQHQYLNILKGFIPDRVNHTNDKLDEDFLLLSWDDLTKLINSNLIQIGVHTKSHEILTNLSQENALKEIIESKNIIEKKLNYPINLFAFPNGKETDFTDAHIKLLKNNGFICSLTTIPKLNLVTDDTFLFGRICIDPRFSANSEYFLLNTSGFIPLFNSLKNKLFH